MHTGELNTKIPVLRKEDVTIVKRLDVQGSQGGYNKPFIVSFNGQRAFMKPPYSNPLDSRGVELMGVNQWSSTMEANALYALQGIVGVPKLYGVMGENPGGMGPYMDYKDAIVEQLAGTDLSTAMLNTKSSGLVSSSEGMAFLRYLPSIADHVEEILKKGLINRDMKAWDIFLTDDLGKLLVVDYGIVAHASKRDIPTEGKRGSYTVVIKELLQLSMALCTNSSHMLFTNPQYTEEKTARVFEEKFNSQGLESLTSLMGSYAKKEFDKPDYRVFTQFLAQWGKGIREQCKYLSPGYNDPDPQKSTAKERGSINPSQQVAPPPAVASQTGSKNSRVSNADRTLDNLAEHTQCLIENPDLLALLETLASGGPEIERVYDQANLDFLSALNDFFHYMMSGPVTKENEWRGKITWDSIGRKLTNP